VNGGKRQQKLERCGVSQVMLSSFSDTLTSGRSHAATSPHTYAAPFKLARRACLQLDDRLHQQLAALLLGTKPLAGLKKKGHIPPMATSQTETCAPQLPPPIFLRRRYIGVQVGAVQMRWAFCLEPSPTICFLFSRRLGLGVPPDDVTIQYNRT
jgi:hypothetical protein